MDAGGAGGYWSVSGREILPKVEFVILSFFCLRKSFPRVGAHSGLSRVDAGGGSAGGQCWSVGGKCFLAERKTHSRSPGWNC